MQDGGRLNRDHKMSIPLITEYNVSSGIHVLFVYVNDITFGLFISLLLFVIWSAVTFGIYFTNKRTLGDGNFPSCLAVGGFVTGIFAVLFHLIDGLMNFTTYVTIIVISLVSIMFYLFNRND